MTTTRTRRLVALLLGLLLLVAACGEDDGGSVTSEGSGSASGSAGGSGSGSGSAPAEGGAITVGSADFAESTIVASMYAQVLEANGYDVSTEFGIGAREVYFPALEEGEVDLIPEFLASATTYLEGEGSNDLDEARSALEEVLPEGLIALTPAPAQSTNVFVVTAETAEAEGLSKVSDLEGKDLVLGGPPECPQRPFCIPGLKETYDVDLSAGFKPLDAGGPITKEALTEGEIDVALLFSTDPGIPENGWVILEDDQGLQQAENVVPVGREEVLDDEAQALIDSISELLTDEEYVELIGRVYIDGEEEEAVATDWLTENGLLE